MELMSCGKDKATRLFRELDQNGIGLIERKKQGQGRPTRIYVKNFTLSSDADQPRPEQTPPCNFQIEEDQQSEPLDDSAVKTAPFEQSAPLEMRGQDCALCAPNKTDKNETYPNDTDSSILPPIPALHISRPAGKPKLRMRMDEMDGYREKVRENINYSLLLQEHPYDLDEINGYVELMAETCASRLSGTFGADRADFLANLGDYDLLIIDDLGVERGTEHALEQVFNIIDSRCRSGKPLIVTTNLKLGEIKHPPDLAHARIYDRILERCAPILFAGKNFREDNAASTKAAARKITTDRK